MPEIRHNALTGEWVIIAPERAHRPHEVIGRATRPRVDHDPSCPFCPGNESRTPAETWRAPSDGAWRVRCFPNKFSVLDPEGEPGHGTAVHGARARGVGLHEVVVESHRHDGHLAESDLRQVERVVRAWQERFRAFHADRRVRHVMLFQNHGPAAGTSLAHPHSQLVGLPLRPAEVARRDEMKLRYFAKHDRCLACDTLRSELDHGTRVVLSTDRFVAVVPWAALSPFHTWILPRHHQSSFADIDADSRRDFARVLHELLHRLVAALDDPDYNLVFQSGAPDGEQPHLHWYASVVPRLALRAGFELGTGMYVNPSLPDESAATLRDAPWAPEGAATNR